MAHYLVTGGLGFIGHHLCQALLDAQHQVTVVDNLDTGRLENKREGSDFIEGDITDVGLMHELLQQVDGCFHLAALVWLAHDTHRLAAGRQIESRSQPSTLPEVAGSETGLTSGQ